MPNLGDLSLRELRRQDFTGMSFSKLANIDH